ncbi:MAG: dienelactone hydrolase family protein [Alphaproteobacteria bacterium]|nr:dienelactone hydrolase family protein [Alphaproteobacteria bacterium]
MIGWIAGLLGCGGVAATPAEPYPLEFLEASPDDREALPLIVAIHGNNGRPERMLAMAGSCGLRARVLAPRAPRETPNGWTWFDLWTANPERFDAPEAVRMADLLAETIRRYAADRPTVGAPVVTGFSQGGILTYTVAARSPEVMSAAVPISGVIFRSMMKRDVGKPPKIRALHPELDPQAPLRVVQKVVEGLREEGVDIELEVVEGVAHGFGEEMRPAWCRTLASVLPR